MASFTCADCGRTFSLPQATLERYPGWTPKRCRVCRNGSGGPASVEENLTLAQVLDRHTGGPSDGVFTDGSAIPNPGPGGWGAVYVVGGQVVAQRHGRKPQTTNNEMELTALVEGYGLVPTGTPATVYSDSGYAVKIVNEWSADWARRGWRRKRGPISNLALVKRLHELHVSRPEIEVAWIAAHRGNRWNEYADSLATAWMRDEL